MSEPAADIPEQKDSTRVPKPLMEKRRRDRINQSLETLRLLLLENTHNEKLKNPKVEKAEILESVVNFLRADQKSQSDSYQITRGKRGRTEDYDGDLSSPCKRQSYNDGIRTCLLRVSQFIANKNHEFGQREEKQHGNLQHNTLKHSMQTQLLAAASPHRERQVHLQHQQHHVQLSNSYMSSGCSKLAQRTVTTMAASPKQPVSLCDSVWRPWPQSKSLSMNRLERLAGPAAHHPE